MHSKSDSFFPSPVSTSQNITVNSSSSQILRSNHVATSVVAKNLLRREKNVSAPKKTGTSPASTVMSSVILTSNQNTYNSIDSSGYNTSSTLDVADPHDSLKASFATCATPSKCPETFLQPNNDHQAILRSPHNKSISPPVTPSQKNKHLSPPNSLNHPVNSNLSNPKIPTPAPRLCYSSSSSHTPSPTLSQLPDSKDPWEHQLPSSHCLHTPPTINKNKIVVNPLFVEKPPKISANDESNSPPTNHQEKSDSSSNTKRDSWFSNEGRCRYPITSFDILPTEKLLLNQKLQKEGETNHLRCFIFNIVTVC